MADPNACELPDPARRGETEAAVQRILGYARRIAVVGASPRPETDSHRIFVYLRSAGYEVFPVRPDGAPVAGLPSCKSLKEIPGPVDVVDIFRRPEQVGPHVDEAIACKARSVWLQLGIVNEEAASKARTAGLDVVMDRCILVEDRRLER